MKKIILSLTLIFTAVSAHSYTPDFWHIIQRTLRNNGKGIYKISQDVAFLTDKEPLLVNETWYIENSGVMRLKVRGKRVLKDKLNFSIVYNNGKKTFINENARITTTAVGDDFYMPYLTFRFEKNFRKFLLKDKIINPSVRTKKPYTWDKEKPYKPEEYLSLGRTNGVVTYMVSNPSVSGESKPKIWIEQDQFLIRRIRFESGAEFKANEFSRHSHGYHVPKAKIVSWDDKNIQINTLSVKPLTKSKKVKELLYSKKLTKDDDGAMDFTQIEEPTIKEFYSRFR